MKKITPCLMLTIRRLSYLFLSFILTLLFVSMAAASPGDINTLAGMGLTGYLGDGGPADLAGLNHPSGMAVDASGNIYFSDQADQRVRKVDVNGVISTI